jgi:DNA-binding HxlR family transcriptional regulator
MDDSAEVFEAIAHPTRIRILKILEKQPASFASLKRQLDMDSSGNLDHHLKKLDSLITAQPDGLYGLTEAGKRALASVNAVEEWKETERLKQRTFSQKPLAVSIFAVLTFLAAAVSISIIAQTLYSDAFNVPFLPAVFGLAAVAGVFSFVGLMLGKGWGWTLGVLQAVLVLAYAMVPLYFDLYAPTVLGQPSTENPSSFVWNAAALLVLVEAAALLLAVLPSVRAFFGKQTATKLQLRAWAAGVLAVFSGLLEIYLGCLAWFAPASDLGSGVAGGLLSFYFVGGLFIVLGGVAVLLRRFTVGAVAVLVFSLFPFPYYSTASLFSSILAATPVLFPLNLLLASVLVALPYAASALSFLSRPKKE